METTSLLTVLLLLKIDYKIFVGYDNYRILVSDRVALCYPVYFCVYKVVVVYNICKTALCRDV
jgi:hypothetical protein